MEGSFLGEPEIRQPQFSEVQKGGNQENLSISEIAVNAHAFRDPGLDPMYLGCS